MQKEKKTDIYPDLKPGSTCILVHKQTNPSKSVLPFTQKDYIHVRTCTLLYVHVHTTKYSTTHRFYGGGGAVIHVISSSLFCIKHTAHSTVTLLTLQR